jgi:hemerythrin-like domain-containing protein
MSQNGSAYADTRNTYIIHIVFRREFGLMPDLVQSVAHEDEERAKVIADHIRFLSNVLLHHHEAEDAVLWPLLLARAPKETDPVVHLAQRHHQRIDTLLDKVDARLAAWVDGAAIDDADTLAQTLRELAVVLFEHMGMEEQLVLPLVERHIFTSEWQRMEEHAVSAIAPQDAALVFGMALYEGSEDIVPEPMRGEILLVAPGVYADYAERLHGTRTPPRAKDVLFGAPYVAPASSASGEGIVP